MTGAGTFAAIVVNSALKCRGETGGIPAGDVDDILFIYQIILIVFAGLNFLDLIRMLCYLFRMPFVEEGVLAGVI